MGLKVIGAGLSRTGTKSLKLALEQLGYDKCFHMIELMKAPQRLKYLKELEAKGTTNWEALFDGFQATVDHPTCLYYKEMLDKYPSAKVILTIRDPEKWYQSVYNTIYRIKPKSGKDILKMIWGSIRYKELRQVAPVFMHNDKIIWDGQFQSKFEDKKTAIKLYHQHNEEVQKYVPKDQLLVMEIKEGWQPICEFLGHEIPNVPFPNLNQQAVLNSSIDKLVNEGIFIRD